MTSPTEDEVGRLVLPLVMEGIWRKRPDSKDMDPIMPYLKFGKVCIFGKRGENMGLVQIRTIQTAREAMQNFGKDSPVGKALDTLIEKNEYSSLKRTYAEISPSTQEGETLRRDVADAILFAAFLGTTDMAHKCAVYQRRDKAHVRMFRRDPTAYLHELMRYDSAVTSFTSALVSPETWNLEGFQVDLPEATPVQMVLASANRDPSVFEAPDVFDPKRHDIGEQVSWNGKLKDVIARNYSAAPRFCPGYALSVKVATAVCEELTRDLEPWSSEKPSEVITGLVQILKPGPVQKRQGMVSYFDFSRNQHCVIDRFKPGIALGCYDASELKVIDRHGVARTLDEELAKCPAVTVPIVHMFAHYAVSSYQAGWLSILESVGIKARGTEIMSPDWAGDFAVALYAGIVHTTLRAYVARHANSVKVPKYRGLTETFRVGSILAPNVDIDHPHFMPIERFIPARVWDASFLPGLNCFMGALRSMPWDDMLEEGDVRNNWSTVLSHARVEHKSEKDWVMSFYKTYHAMDGVSIWPREENNLGALYFKNDEWDDELERAIAFGLIGAHRVQVVSKEFRGESLPYVVSLNSFSKLEVRPHFGKYGVDLYFSAAGLPVMLETPDGRQVVRGDKDWQYWKFVWRSSLITVITLVDHLHMTHFRAGNSLARATRQSLSPDHPMRRLLSVFTFGTIFVNLNAMHTLIGPNHVLHRSTPFKEFEALSSLVPSMLPPPTEAHKALMDDAEYARLPQILHDAPYFADGRLLVAALRRMIDRFQKIFKGSWCDDQDGIVDEELIALRDELASEMEQAKYRTNIVQTSNCSRLHEELVASAWTVTGWHRHVGTVGDLYADPRLASFSWKDGEAISRPKQHMMLSVVAAFTGTEQPKLIEDFSHVFKGIEHEGEVLNILRDFRKELFAIHDEIARRNEKRLATVGYKNVHADPKIVECSVAV